MDFNHKSFIMNTIEKITKSVKELSNSTNIDKEPVLCIFNHKGLTCVVVRNYVLNYCGYVEKLHDIDFSEIEVHGGITFENHLDHISEELKGKVFIGFDTCHSGDLLVIDIPGSMWKLNLSNHNRYRSFRYVMEQTINLAEQLYVPF